MKIRITNETGESYATRITDEAGRPFKWVTDVAVEPFNRDQPTVTARLTFAMVEINLVADWPDTDRERVLNRIAEQRAWLDRVEADIRGPSSE